MIDIEKGRYYRIEEVAEALGVSSQAVQKMVKEKRINYIRPGERCILIPKQALRKEKRRRGLA